MFKRKKRTVEQKPVLTHQEQIAIRQFARGQESFREEALKIYNYHLNVWNMKDIKIPDEILFMSEVTNPVPDYAYRRSLRERLQGHFEGIDTPIIYTPKFEFEPCANVHEVNTSCSGCGRPQSDSILTIERLHEHIFLCNVCISVIGTKIVDAIP